MNLEQIMPMSLTIINELPRASNARSEGRREYDTMLQRASSSTPSTFECPCNWCMSLENPGYVNTVYSLKNWRRRRSEYLAMAKILSGFVTPAASVGDPNRPRVVDGGQDNLGSFNRHYQCKIHASQLCRQYTLQKKSCQIHNFRKQFPLERSSLLRERLHK